MPGKSSKNLLHSPLREKVRASCGKGPGVYRFTAGGETIYIGRSRSLRTRLLSYFRAEGGSKGNLIASAADDVEWTETDSEFACHLTELRLIKQLRPHYNVQMKDDRDYVFIRIGQGPAPKLLLSRTPTQFGPFRSPQRVTEAIKQLSDIFQLRASSDATPLLDPRQLQLFEQGPLYPRCLRGQIGLCLAPCAGRVGFDVYAERLSAVERFLRGDEQGILDALREKMLDASRQLQFERASVYRDRLQRLEALASALNFLRESLDKLTFVYAVPGETGRDMLHFIHGGRVVGQAPRVRGPRQAEKAALLAEKLLELAPPPGSGDEMDEIKIVASWFRAHPQALARTLPAKAFLRDVRQWPVLSEDDAEREDDAEIEMPVVGLSRQRKSA